MNYGFLVPPGQQIAPSRGSGCFSRAPSASRKRGSSTLPVSRPWCTCVPLPGQGTISPWSSTPHCSSSLCRTAPLVACTCTPLACLANEHSNIEESINQSSWEKKRTQWNGIRQGSEHEPSSPAAIDVGFACKIMSARRKQRAARLVSMIDRYLWAYSSSSLSLSLSGTLRRGQFLELNVRRLA
jgi:hypothetical protein